MSDPYNDYFNPRPEGSYRLVRRKKSWVPEFLWAFASDLFNLGWRWPAEALSEIPT